MGIGDNFIILDGGMMTREELREMSTEDQIGWVLSILRDLVIEIEGIKENII